MFEHIHKYTLARLQERFDLDKNDIVLFMECGILLPDEWLLRTEKERSEHIADDLRWVRWDYAEVERFALIRRLFEKKYFTFTNRILRRFDELDMKLNDRLENLQSYSHKTLIELADLKNHVDKKDVWIDTNHFHEVTGHPKNYIWNRFEKIDDSHSVLNISPYEKIIWTRRGKGKGKLYCKLIDFEEARKRMPYELNIEERKRKGKFKAPVKIIINEKFKL